MLYSLINLPSILWFWYCSPRNLKCWKQSCRQRPPTTTVWVWTLVSVCKDERELNGRKLFCFWGGKRNTNDSKCLCSFLTLCTKSSSSCVMKTIWLLQGHMRWYKAMFVTLFTLFLFVNCDQRKVVNPFITLYTFYEEGGLQTASAYYQIYLMAMMMAKMSWWALVCFMWLQLFCWRIPKDHYRESRKRKGRYISYNI